MSNTVELYITDKTGKKFFKTSCGAGYSSGELHNLQIHLKYARLHPKHYAFLDIDTARVVNGDESTLDMSPEAMMRFARGES